MGYAGRIPRGYLVSATSGNRALPRLNFDGQFHSDEAGELMRKNLRGAAG